MILGTRFEVNISARVSEALSLFGNQTFELVVVCRAAESWRQFADFVAQQNPAPRILAVTTTEHEVPSWADVIVCSTKGPFELLQVCAEMFGMTMKKKSQGFSNRTFKRVVPAA